MPVDLAGTTLYVNITAGSVGGLNVETVSTAATACAGDYCGRIGGSIMAQPVSGPTNYYFEFSQQVALFGVQLLDIDRDGLISLTTSGVDANEGPTSLTATFTCQATANPSFGCESGEFIYLARDKIRSTGDTFSEASLTHDTGDTTAYLDNLRVCMIVQPLPDAVDQVVSFLPATHDFGAIAINRKKTATQVFTITNNVTYELNGEPLSITGISLSGSDAHDFHFEQKPRRYPITLPSGEAISVAVYFDPYTIGTKNANLVLTTDDPVTPPWILSPWPA